MEIDDHGGTDRERQEEKKKGDRVIEVLGWKRGKTVSISIESAEIYALDTQMMIKEEKERGKKE